MIEQHGSMNKVAFLNEYYSCSNLISWIQMRLIFWHVYMFACSFGLGTQHNLWKILKEVTLKIRETISHGNPKKMWKFSFFVLFIYFGESHSAEKPKMAIYALRTLCFCWKSREGLGLKNKAEKSPIVPKNPKGEPLVSLYFCKH